jgi:hypothetical protein
MGTVDSNAAIIGNINSLVAFVPGMSEQERTDVLNVLLYAQLFASHSRDLEKDWHGWMHVYRNRLVARSFQRKSIIAGNSEVLSSVDDVVQATFKVIGPSASGQLIDLVRRSFDAMGIKQIAKAFFDGDVESGQLGSFQIVPCEKTASGEVSVLLCGLHLSSDDYSQGRQRLIFHFKGGSYSFDNAAYATHRDSVSDYLRNKANATVMHVKI